MDSSNFEIGRETSFVYHGKERSGIVEKVGETAVTLAVPAIEYDELGPVRTLASVELTYRSFRYDKIYPRGWDHV
jgi:hypothetical protein